MQTNVLVPLVKLRSATVQASDNREQDGLLRSSSRHLSLLALGIGIEVVVVVVVVVVAAVVVILGENLLELLGRFLTLLLFFETKVGLTRLGTSKGPLSSSCLNVGAGLGAGVGAGLGLNLFLLGNGMPWKGLSLSNSSKRASLCSTFFEIVMGD